MTIRDHLEFLGLVGDDPIGPGHVVIVREPRTMNAQDITHRAVLLLNAIYGMNGQPGRWQVSRDVWRTMQIAGLIDQNRFVGLPIESRDELEPETVYLLP